MNAPMDISMRRGACPGLSAPMATGDGLLARLTPAGSTIALDAFAGLCGAAQTHGNGIVEITSRGSIQVRGLSAASAPLFAAEVASLGIEAGDGSPLLTRSAFIHCHRVATRWELACRSGIRVRRLCCA